MAMQSFVNIIRQYARQEPDALAIRCEQQAVTYAQLDRHSNQLARALQDQGVKSLIAENRREHEDGQGLHGQGCKIEKGGEWIARANVIDDEDDKAEELEGPGGRRNLLRILPLLLDELGDHGRVERERCHAHRPTQCRGDHGLGGHGGAFSAAQDGEVGVGWRQRACIRIRCTQQVAAKARHAGAHH